MNINQLTGHTEILIDRTRPSAPTFAATELDFS